MCKSVDVKNVKIGVGMPKICASIVSETLQGIKKEAECLSHCDIVEWRSDFFNEIECKSKVKEALALIRDILSNKPIIFTFRNESSAYFDLYKYVIDTELVEIVDIDLQNDESCIRSLINLAHEKNIAVIVSSHNFEKTPSKDEIIEEMRKAQSLGDISKIAVMPNSLRDVTTLLEAAVTMKESFRKPFIAISMSSLGVISRICCEDFGSAITFASGKSASASGQISVLEMQKILKIISNNKAKT